MVPLPRLFPNLVTPCFCIFWGFGGPYFIVVPIIRKCGLQLVWACYFCSMVYVMCRHALAQVQPWVFAILLKVFVCVWLG